MAIQERSDAFDETTHVIYPIQFVQMGNLSGVPTPLARITTCGLMQLEVLKEVIPGESPQGRYDIIPVQTLRGRGAVPALMLLKLLISSPHRFATRDWLSTQMQQEMDVGALVRLDTIASYLRGLLCGIEAEQPRIDALRLLAVAYLRNGRGSGPGYQLANHPLLWLDSDALKYHTEHGALMERMGEAALALPFWQRAYALASRGDYLRDEPHSDWAMDKREDVAGQFRQSVHALHRLCLAEYGKAGEEEAILLLRTYWQSHKTDEDALRPLMELLGKHERFGEAEAYYQQCVAACDEVGDGRQPDQRTQDIREFLRTKQIRRGMIQTASKDSFIETSNSPRPVTDTLYLFSLPSPVIASEQRLFLPPVTLTAISSIHNANTDWSIWFGLKLSELITMVEHWRERAIYCDQLQMLLDQEIKMFDTIKPDDDHKTYGLSRRQALVSIATLPVALYTSIQEGLPSTIMREKLLTRCAASITACWHLLKGSELSLIEQVLSSYILALVSLAQQPSHHQKAAARLASQAYRLFGIVALHRDHLSARENYCQQALYFSQIAESPSFVVSAQISLASTFYYNKKPAMAAHIYQRAFLYKDEIPPLQLSRLYAELAVVYAQQKLEQEAVQSLDLARELYPEFPENDPSFLYAEFSPASMVLEEGLTYLALTQHFADRNYKLNAWNSFARVDELKALRPVPERIYFEITNHRAATALALRDLELLRTYLEKGIEGAQKLNSHQRRQEVRDVYKQATTVWPHENSLKEIQGQFRV